jgi:hypothetical protein
MIVDPVWTTTTTDATEATDFFDEGEGPGRVGKLTFYL